MVSPKLLMIDNYDSFTYNLVQLFLGFDLDITVRRNDRVTIEEIELMQPDYLVISPGPKAPQQAGLSVDIIRAFCGRMPILGVCLGMQCINEAFGGRTVRAPLPVHGKTDAVFHDGGPIFAGIPSPFTAARYHSLAVEPDSNRLAVSAETADHVAMAIHHPDYPLFGVQFHPESFLTEHGARLAENFLAAG
ncbi:MAG: aminodeoxychorismate/anthranilate synthase component II [Thermodesulfobacteriota bacterium]